MNTFPTHVLLRRVIRRGLLMLGVVLLTLAPASRGDAFDGALTQLPGTAGCVSEADTGGLCADGAPLRYPWHFAVSPDGKHVYALSTTGSTVGAVAAFARSKATGALTQLSGTAGCVSGDDTGGACAQARALMGAGQFAVSPDGKQVYVPASDSNAVAVFARSKTTGALTQLIGTAGCVSASTAGCAPGVALDGAVAAAVSPDGKHVYVASYGSEAVAVLARDKATGALTQLPGTAGCVSQNGSGGACAVGVGLGEAHSVLVSPDGKYVYALNLNGAVAVFARDKTTGALTQLTGTAGCVSRDGTGGACGVGTLDYSIAFAVSRDSKHVYVASWNVVTVFARDTTTGALTQLAGAAGCVSVDDTYPACATGRAMHGASAVTVSRDGRNVYVTGFNDSAVAVFARDRTTGALTQLTGTAGCVSETGSGGSCRDGIALFEALAVAVSPDGKHVYVGSADAVAAFTRVR